MKKEWNRKWNRPLPGIMYIYPNRQYNAHTGTHTDR